MSVFEGSVTMADLDDELARFEAEIASLTAGLSGGDDSQDGQSGSAPPAHSPPPSSSPNTTQTSTSLPLPIPVRPPSTSHPVPPPSAHSINAGPSASPAPPKDVEIFQPPVKYHKDAKKPVFQRVSPHACTSIMFQFAHPCHHSIARFVACR